MTKLTYDDKLEVVENALYRLKERDYIQPEDVKVVDDLLAADAVVKVDLYDLIRYHAEPEE